MQTKIQEAVSALREKPVFSTFYQRVELSDLLKNSYLDKPQPIRFGLILHDFLQKVNVPVKKDDLFIGRLETKELSAEEEENYQKFLRDGNNIYKTAIFSNGHCSFDWERIVNLGLDGCGEVIGARLTRENDADKRDWLTGAELVVKAISAFIERLSCITGEMGMDEASSVLKNVAHGKPSTFYEALQLHWIVTFINCSFVTSNPTLTLGRMDRLLLPYYRKDIENGTLTPDRAKQLITDYYCKHNLNMGRGEHQLGDQTNSTTFNRILNFDAPQYLLLAGTDDQGVGVVNELTELFVECIVPEFKNPVVIVHYFKNMNVSYPEVWRKISQKALSSASMMIYNDDDVKNALREVGIPEETVNDYIHYGCNWLGLGLNSYVIYMGPSSGAFCKSLPKDEWKNAGYDLNQLRCNTFGGLSGDFMTVFKEMAESDPQSIDQFYDRFFEVFDAFTKNRLNKLEIEINTRNKCASKILLLGDCFNRYTVENAACQGASGVKWHFDSQGLHGFATAADCFIVVDKLCFEEKFVSVKQLYDATVANFVGHEKLLAKIRKVDKFGTNTPRTNQLASRLLNGIADVLNENNKNYIDKGIVMLPTVQNDTWHIKYGTKFPATPDGRLANQPFSQNSHPSNGANKNGMTAMLSAMNSLPMERFVSGAFHFDVQPKDFEGEAGLKNFENLLGTYLNNGGLHAQVSSVNVDELKDAQVHPQNHSDLRVRVTGYSGIFVDVTKELQDDIIDRMR